MAGAIIPAAVAAIGAGAYKDYQDNKGAGDLKRGLTQDLLGQRSAQNRLLSMTPEDTAMPVPPGSSIQSQIFGGVGQSGVNDPAGYAAIQQGLFKNARPDLAMASMAARFAPAPAVLKDTAPGTSLGYIRTDPNTGLPTYNNLYSAPEKTPDKALLLQSLTSKIAALGSGTPAAKPYEDALAAENIAVTNARETSRHNRADEAHNNAMEANAEWIPEKDALGNPFLINKKTTEVKRPNGLQADTDETIAPVAKMIANYDLPPLTSVALLKPYGQRVMAEVQKLNPDYSGDQFQVRKGAKASFASGKNGTLVRQANTSTSHLLTLEKLGDALDTGDVQAVNQMRNTLSSQFGGADIAGYEAAAKMVGDEVNKFIGGGPGASADREDYSKALSAAKSPQQRKAVMNAIKALMVGQLGSLGHQYETETKAKDFGDKLEPEVAALLGNPQYAIGRNPTRAMGGDQPPGPPPIGRNGRPMKWVTK